MIRVANQTKFLNNEFLFETLGKLCVFLPLEIVRNGSKIFFQIDDSCINLQNSVVVKLFSFLKLFFSFISLFYFICFWNVNLLDLPSLAFVVVRRQFGDDLGGDKLESLEDFLGGGVNAVMSTGQNEIGGYNSSSSEQ